MVVVQRESAKAEETKLSVEEDEKLTQEKADDAERI